MRSIIITAVLATLVLGLATSVTALTDRTSSAVFALDFQAPVVTLTAPDTSAVIGGGAPIRFVWEAWDHNPRPDASAVQLVVHGAGGVVLDRGFPYYPPGLYDWTWNDPPDLSSGMSWSVVMIDTHGNETTAVSDAITVTDVDEGATPRIAALSRPVPNPFNPTTTIAYEVPARGFVDLRIYDVEGKEVTNLSPGVAEAGRYELQWRPVDLPSGLYVARLVFGDQISTQKLMLLR